MSIFDDLMSGRQERANRPSPSTPESTIPSDDPGFMSFLDHLLEPYAEDIDSRSIAQIVSQSFSQYTGRLPDQNELSGFMDEYATTNEAREYYDEIMTSDFFTKMHPGRAKRYKEGNDSRTEFSQDNLQRALDDMNKPGKQKRLERWEGKDKETGIDTGKLGQYTETGAPEVKTLGGILQGISESPEALATATRPQGRQTINMGREGLTNMVMNMMNQRRNQRAILGPYSDRQRQGRWREPFDRFGGAKGTRSIVPPHPGGLE